MRNVPSIHITADGKVSEFVRGNQLDHRHSGAERGDDRERNNPSRPKLSALRAAAGFIGEVEEKQQTQIDRMLQVSGKDLNSIERSGRAGEKHPVFEQSALRQQEDQRKPRYAVDGRHVLCMRHHGSAEFKQNRGEQCRRGAPDKAASQVIHKQARQKKVQDDLYLHQFVRQIRKGTSHDKKPVDGVKNLRLGIADNGISRHHIGVPERHPEVPQFFMHEAEVRIEKIGGVKREHEAIGEKNLRKKDGGQSRQQRGNKPFAAFIQKRHIWLYSRKEAAESNVGGRKLSAGRGTTIGSQAENMAANEEFVE